MSKDLKILIIEALKKHGNNHSVVECLKELQLLITEIERG